jgi:putative ATP-binding cassette transporter
MRDGGFSDEDVSEALATVGLQHLNARLNEQHNWSMQLSPGEQQRVAFARAVLLQPAWLFLDEATSSLDENAEQELYRMVKERLPKTTIISIGHRSSLQDFHSRTLELRSDEHGSLVLTAA